MSDYQKGSVERAEVATRVRPPLRSGVFPHIPNV